ncbi:hypothetical protein [Streptomyces sp. NPDC048611]|uniref:hypothetical protein n=1 Tax=Streptomyces sp. NPDC048611 TaxID=3155635 RepID=UPI0034287F68
MTAVDGAHFSDVQFNRYIRDNLLECAPAKAGAAGQHFAVDDLNQLSARTIQTAFISTSQTTTSTTFADLATVGPTVTVETGRNALIWINCQISHATANIQASASFEISGATTWAANNIERITHDGNSAGQSLRYSQCTRYPDLTPGTNTFKMKYRVSSGTGTFARREIIVLPL